MSLLAAAQLASAQEDWVQLARLNLANYALTKAGGAPSDVFCSKKGKKEAGCHCWNEAGKPETDGDDCNSPTGCLVYSTKSDGNLSYAKLNASDDLSKTLSGWSVPSDMVKAFELALLTENATFTTFDFTLNPGNAKYEAHVGTARLHEAQRFLGYTFGKSDGDLVQPKIRTSKVPAGDCHGTTRGMKDRGYTDDELDAIRKTLASTAFKKAASQAQPGGLVGLAAAVASPQGLPTTQQQQSSVENAALRSNERSVYV